MLSRDSDGEWWCLSHHPERRAELTAAATLGGIRSGAKIRKGLNPTELGPLRTLEDAERWASVVGAAVATGTLSAQQGNAVMRAVSEFRSAHSEGRLADRLAALEKQVRKQQQGKRR
jgi:hypothetical protein